MSRDLDRQVAQALGYAVCTGVSTYDGSDLPYEVWITDPARADEPPLQRQDVTLNPVPYSTDIAAAWTLVEYMRARGWIYTLGDDDENDHGSGKHFAGFYRDGSGLYESTAETAPLAIARALVAAMGGT